MATFSRAYATVWPNIEEVLEEIWDLRCQRCRQPICFTVEIDPCNEHAARLGCGGTSDKLLLHALPAADGVIHVGNDEPRD